MLPSILAKQLKQGIRDYIETTFPMTNEPFKGSVRKMLDQKDFVYHEPYTAYAFLFACQIRCRFVLKQYTRLTSRIYIRKKHLNG